MYQVAERRDEAGQTIFPPESRDESAGRRNVACLICGSAMHLAITNVTDNRLGTIGKYDILRCVGCGFEQTYPVPSQAELKELYEKHYNFGGEANTSYTRLREWFLSSDIFRAWLWLDGDGAFLLRRGSGRLLDVGCNEGRGLRRYAANGFQVEGLDLNEAAAEVARRAGFTVHTRLLEELNCEGSYNVIVLSNVLEHSLDPRRMLLEAHRLLAPAGEVWVSLPNSESWLRKVFGRSWINWHVPFHVSHFCNSTLSQLLADTGYTRIKTRQLTPALWVGQSLIARIFAKQGEKTRQLRNPLLALGVMMIARFLLFPILWIGNRTGCGDCLIAVATKV